MSKRIHSVSALFDTPDDIIHAAEKTKKAGYTRFDVNTPYPVHGMDDAMGLKPTMLPFCTLFFGLMGFFIALGLQWWTSGDPMPVIGGLDFKLPYFLERYPLVIGGKPLFSLPAFIPVMFELTVLLSALGTVGCLIAGFCNLPANGHPIQDSNYIRATACDRYGVCIESTDPRFDLEEVKAFLIKAGGKEIEIHMENEPLKIGLSNNLGFGAILATVAIVVSAKTYFVYNIMLYLPPWTWMSEQPKVLPQRVVEFLPASEAMMAPPKGTVARGFMPYRYAGNPDEAASNLLNPVPVTGESLKQGKNLFDIHCSVCHGYQGKGDSRLNGQFPAPPSLHSEKNRNLEDGRFYHIITEGQNVMPGYAKHISEEDRWKIVNYIRALQRAVNAKESDL